MNRIQQIIASDPVFQKAHNEYLQFSQDDATRCAYESRMAFLRDQESREYYAREDGKLEAKLETVHNMLKFGIHLETIAAITDLSPSQIEQASLTKTMPLEGPGDRHTMGQIVLRGARNSTS